MGRDPLSSCLIELFMLPFRLLFGVSKSVIRQRTRKARRPPPQAERKLLVAEQRWARFAMGMWKEAGDDVQGIEQAEVKGRDFAKKAVASTPDSP